MKHGLQIFSSISHGVMALEKDQSQPGLRRGMITVTVTEHFVSVKPYSISIHSILLVMQLKHKSNHSEVKLLPKSNLGFICDCL